VSELTTLDRLVFSQKAKLVELTNEYGIRDEQGNDVGTIRQEGQSTARKILRFATKVDQFLTHKLAVYDQSGAKVLALTRPAKVLKSTILVEDGGGRPIGRIAQRNVFGKISFSLDSAGGAQLGEIKAENWRAWDFAIVDSSGREIGRITKKWVGLGKAIFTTADNYVFEIDASVSGELRLLALASAAAVDTALKQDDRGFALTDIADLPG